MKRFLLIITLMSGIVGLLCSSGTRAQQVIFTPTCAGTDDTAAIQAIIDGSASNPRTIQIPYKSNLAQRCRITTLTVPSNVALDNTNGSGLYVVTSISDAGSRINPVGKTLFFGSGSVTLTGRAYDSLADATHAGLVTTTTSSSQAVSTDDPRLRTTVACAGTDDTAALAAANALGGTIVILKGVTCASNTQTITASINIQNGGLLKPLAAQTVTINGFVDAGSYNIFTGSTSGKIVLGTTANPIYKSIWWTEQTVTVPGPTLAPSLSIQSVFGFGAQLVDGTTYQVAYSYDAYNGETGLSPVSSFVAKNTQSLAVMPFASLANNSKYADSVFVYISPDAGVTWHRADTNGYFTRNGQISFGDDTAGWGGALVAYTAGGASPPAPGTTTTTFGGTTVSPPLVAPTLTNIHANAAATYYLAYAYLCGDGTSSALSPVSIGLVAIAGSGIVIVLNNEPPSGAVAIQLYAGTSATTSAMHLQATVPLSYVSPEIQDYSTAGGAPSAGAAQSIISNVQQAYDAMMESGAQGKILVGPGPTLLKTPFIARLKNSAGTQIKGLQIQGIGSYNQDNNAAGRMYYAGTVSTAVVGVLVSTSGLEWNGLSVNDPNGRLTAGVAICDYFGGGGFFFRPSNSFFYAGKSGAAGLSIPTAAGFSHTPSELHADNCAFYGDAWGIDIHGAQTGDLLFRDCNFNTNGNSNSKNSGGIRMAAGFQVLFDGSEIGGAAGGYPLYINGDDPHPRRNFGPTVTVRNMFTDASSAWVHFFYISPVGSGVSLTVDGCYLGSTITAADKMALYVGLPSSVVISNVIGAGNGRLNWTATTDNIAGPLDLPQRSVITQLGQWSFLGQSATQGFKVTATSNADGTNNAQKASVNLWNGLPYRKYVAVLTQSSTSAPTATQVENTLGGQIAWARSGAGTYTATMTGAFLSPKTVVLIQMNPSGGTAGIAFAGRTSDNVVTLVTKDAATNTATDGLLTAATVEIRVYYP